MHVFKKTDLIETRLETGCSLTWAKLSGKERCGGQQQNIYLGSPRTYIFLSLCVIYLNIRQWCASSTHGRRQCCLSDVLKWGCGIMIDSPADTLVTCTKWHNSYLTLFLLPALCCPSLYMWRLITVFNTEISQCPPCCFFFPHQGSPRILYCIHVFVNVKGSF